MSENEWRKQCEVFPGEVDEDFQIPVVSRPGTRPPTLPALRNVPLTLCYSHGTKWGTEQSAAQHGFMNAELLQLVLTGSTIGCSWPPPARDIPIVAPAIRSGGTNECLTNWPLMEYCCGENSRLCNERFNDKGCATARLTIANDLTAPEGPHYVFISWLSRHTNT